MRSHHNQQLLPLLLFLALVPWAVMGSGELSPAQNKTGNGTISSVEEDGWWSDLMTKANSWIFNMLQGREETCEVGDDGDQTCETILSLTNCKGKMSSGSGRPSAHGICTFHGWVIPTFAGLLLLLILTLLCCICYCCCQCCKRKKQDYNFEEQGTPLRDY